MSPELAIWIVDHWYLGVAVVILAWLVVKPRPRYTSRPDSRGPRYWFQYDGGQMAGWCSTPAEARVQAQRLGGEYIGRYDIYPEDYRGRS